TECPNAAKESPRHGRMAMQNEHGSRSTARADGVAVPCPRALRRETYPRSIVQNSREVEDSESIWQENRGLVSCANDKWNRPRSRLTLRRNPAAAEDSPTQSSRSHHPHQRDKKG